MSLFLAELAIGCSSSSDSSASSGNDCQPPPESCDNPAPTFYQADLINHCVLPAQVALADICSTTVNRCAPSGGLGPSCAFAPDGGVFIQEQSDNYIYSATGWKLTAFLEYVSVDQRASDAQQTECYDIECWPACSGAPHQFRSSCETDAGSN